MGVLPMRHVCSAAPPSSFFGAVWYGFRLLRLRLTTYDGHCSITVAAELFFSPHLFPLTVVRLLFTEPVKLEFLAPPAPVPTRYSV